MSHAISTKTFAQRSYYGLQGAAKGWLLARLYQDRPFVWVVCRDVNAVTDLIEDLKFFAPGAPIFNFPSWDTLPFEPVSPQSIVSAQRLLALDRLASGKPYLMVCAVDALTQKIIPQNLTKHLSRTLGVGQTISLEQVASDLELAGFRPVSLVEEIGEMAIRGGVIDFFPSTSQLPIRIEFLDNVVETIRSFDLDTQRSLNPLESIAIIPVAEFVNFKQDQAFHSRVDQAIEQIKAQGKKIETPPRELARVMALIRSGSAFPGVEWMNALALSPLEDLFSQISSSALVVLDDHLRIEQHLDSFWELISERESRLRQEHYLLPDKEDVYLSPEEFREKLNSLNLYFLDNLEVLDNLNQARFESINLRTTSNSELSTRLKSKIGSGKALSPLRDHIRLLRSSNYEVAFVVGSKSRAQRLHSLLLEVDIDAHITELSADQWLNLSNRSAVVIITGHISGGFQLPSEKLVFISEGEIFSERSYRRSGKAKTNLKRLLSSLGQLKEDDFVVHIDYGIGIYRGLKHLSVAGVESDLLNIEYADSRLYLPVQNIGKVQKFVAAEGKAPVLDKLSSTRWVKTRQKVKESVATLAGDLIKLYAARSLAKGWRFEPYGAEDERFADGFAYNETPDQLKTIEETLTDMASEKPMDRLVCGDVGFGKTEVAIRAAFKCVQHTRQVAVLVPTTILVEQHKKNFENRFLGYPVKITAMSRFYTPEDNKATLAGLANGEIDIVIGTHKLLQKDVEFKDLGLIIIDEEHRFGVKQKERLKQLKTQVDVLALTATPIPRTLHMSLLGIRDISIINTPPQDRRVISTYVAARNDVLIRDAIMRELQRGGQIFFVHNRIEGIELLTAELKELVPEARFAIGHGQMTEAQLESIMSRFLNREVDVLVSTTIVESGLDIPNANTIIIDRADMFGLAQLYQLRGRVGRSDRQAYAYLLVPNSRKIGADAQKRLKVLQSLDDLGLGFNLAMRDLEIRGAGNLLGKEQSGSVLAVGFDLYSRILKEAVLNLKGEELPLEDTIDPELKLGVTAYIPDHYIPDISERLILYQRLAQLSLPEEALDLSSEIEDRFGHYGQETWNFIELMRLRALLRIFGVTKLEFTNSKIVISFSPRARIDPIKVIALVNRNSTKYKFGKNHILSIVFERDTIENPGEIFPLVETTLRSIAQEEE